MAEDGNTAEEQVIKDSYVCPHCGEEKPYFKGIVDQLKAEERVPEDWEFYNDLKQGPVYPPDKMASVPIGTKIPGYFIATDICCNCGRDYIVKLKVTQGQMQMRQQPQKLIAPEPHMNRQMRRHPENFGLNFGGGIN